MLAAVKPLKLRNGNFEAHSEGAVPPNQIAKVTAIGIG
jgi:hypothetical protein